MQLHVHMQAITRANLYIEVGADASFVEAPRSDEELIEIGKSTKVGMRDARCTKAMRRIDQDATLICCLGSSLYCAGLGGGARQGGAARASCCP